MTFLQRVRAASSAHELRVCLAAAMRLLQEQDREIDQLRAENALLRRSLAMVCRQDAAKEHEG